MKQKINILMLITVCWAVAAWAAPVDAENRVVVDTAKVRFPTAPDLWGIFFKEGNMTRRT